MWPPLRTKHRTFPTPRKALSCPLPTKAITVLGCLLLFKRKRNSRGMYIRCLGKQEVIPETRVSRWGWRVRPSTPNWAAPPPAVVAGFRSAGFRVCFLSTIWMNRHVARLENRRRKPFLCPNTTEKVSIHWLQSHASLVLLQFYLSHLVLRPGCSWMFWLHIHSLLVCFHTWLLFQERLDRFNSGWQFSPIASSSGCTVNALSELH